MQHLKIRANGATFHVARAGSGPALLLLHGWPEFWFTWEPVMAQLADRHILFYSRRTCAASATATSIRWRPEHDPLFPYAWTDRFGATFSNLDLALFPGVGHFPRREDPDRAAAEIGAFFRRIGWNLKPGARLKVGPPDAIKTGGPVSRH